MIKIAQLENDSPKSAAERAHREEVERLLLQKVVQPAMLCPVDLIGPESLMN